MLTIETTRYSAVIKAFVEFYPSAVVKINHKIPSGDAALWCTNKTFKSVIDFSLTVDGKTILSFHDKPSDMWADDEALPLVKMLAEQKFLRFEEARFVKKDSGLKTVVEFRTDIFPPFPDEDELVNPGIWGKRLADFLCGRLRERGYLIGTEPFAEDWGWMFQIKNKEFDLWIDCRNYEEYPDGFLCSISPHKPYIRKFFIKKISTSHVVTVLQSAIDHILEKEAAIRDKHWWTYEEFNNQGKKSQ